MKVLIIGYARSGKDTLAEYLRDNYDLSFESSSMAAARIFIFNLLKGKYGYVSLDECFEDRINHRKEWYDLICHYNKDDKLRLAKDILKDSDVYVGMRSIDEVRAAKEQNLFDLIIWVDGGKRVDAESNESMTVTKDFADITVDNSDNSPDKMFKTFGVISFILNNYSAISE